MKRILLFVLALVVLLHLWGCGATPADSSANSQDGAISALQEEDSELNKESQLESISITVLSENETVAYVEDFINYISEFVQTYTGFLDSFDDSISYSDIEGFEELWGEKLVGSNEKVAQLKALSFPDKYSAEYSTICDIAETLQIVAKKLANWDTNDDGAYTDHEVNELIQNCSDSLRNLPVEDLQDIITESTENETDMAKEIRENHEKTQSLMDNAKKCEVCGKIGSFELVGFSGEKEYYCYEHYKEMEDIVKKVLGKTESSSSEDKPSKNSTGTMGEKNALKAAKSYLDYTAFSYKGLIEQLEYEGYSHSEAVYGADNCGANWNEQAVKCAAEYLDYTSFSRSGLIEQLEYEGFTHDQAVYAVEQNGY